MAGGGVALYKGRRDKLMTAVTAERGGASPVRQQAVGRTAGRADHRDAGRRPVLACSSSCRGCCEEYAMDA